jgi:hypothetical protein
VGSAQAASFTDPVQTAAGTSVSGLVLASVGDGTADSAFTTPSGLVFGNGVTVTESASASSTLQSQHEFVLAPRSATDVTYPVPTLRPTTPTSLLSLAVMPNGQPSPDPSSGTAWIDVCNQDFLGAELSGRSLGGSTARIGVGPSWVEFGSRSFNGAANVSVWLTVGGTPSLVLNTSGQPTFQGNNANQPYVGSFTNSNSGSAAYSSWEVVGNSGHALSATVFSSKYSPISAYAGYAALQSSGTPGLIVSSSGNIRWASGGYGNFRGLLDAQGNWFFGPYGNLSPTSTNGFLSIPSGAGAPKGVPATQPGCTPLYCDTVNNKLWAYNGSWVGVALP